MAPELLTQIDSKELHGLAVRIQAYQAAKELSDNALVKKFPNLGSTKTYKKILSEDFSELDLERQLNNYRAAVALIESVGDVDERKEELYEDLSPVVALKRCVFEAMRETNIARVIVALGDTGTGKTSMGQVLVDRFGSRILWLEADECWGDSPMNFLGDVLKSMGIRELPMSIIARRDKVIERLCETRVCMVIDEGHHMGPRILNTLKALVNKTPGEFVILALPTLWRKVEREAWEEVRQLTGNRLAERIQIQGLKESDLRKFIARRAPGLNGELGQAVKIAADRAHGRGNLAFIRDVCKRAAELAGGEPVNLEHWTTAVAAEVESR